MAVVDNNYKMISLPGNGETQYELYDLKKDSAEQNNLTAKLPKVAKRLRKKLQSIDASVTASVNGQDYPGTKSTLNRREYSGGRVKRIARIFPSGSSGPSTPPA